MKKILVTGAGGFVGSRVVQQWAGRYEFCTFPKGFLATAREDAVRQAITLLTRSLRQTAQQPPYSAMELQILGPAPAPVVKVNGSYRYRLLLLGENNAQVRGLLSSFMRAFAQRAENRRLHIRVDCDLMD
mgnify:CR=1 FL=1